MKIKLPACGMFIGSGIYNTYADYLTGSGRIHTTWMPQSISPLEYLDKIIEDNQGNLAQLWAFNGGVNAVTFARHHALEDLGMVPPEPDWENRKNLRVEDWVDPNEWAHRRGAGALKFIQKAAEKDIYTVLLYTDAAPEWSTRFQEEGEHYLGYDFGEIFTFRLEGEHLSGVSGQEVTLKLLADDLLARVKEFVDDRHATGWGNVMATSGNFYLDYEIAAGADIPLVEDFAFKHLNVSSALSRGLVRQFDLPLWGSHLAHEYYAWLPYSSPHKFPLLMAGMYQKYMAGAKMMILESGNWYLQSHFVTDSPLFETPRVEPGGTIQQRGPELYSNEVLEQARASYVHIDYNSPMARQYRKCISDFYDFVKEHGTPEGQPETTIALAKGNLDLCGQEFGPNAPIAGVYDLAERNPIWFEGAPERGWVTAKNVFFPRPPVLAPDLNHYLSGTPYGQVDIVSFVNDQPTAEFLNANYRALLFSGWNTCSAQQYGVLKQYVENGGTLFLAISHLSTNITRNYSTYTVDELVNGGDFSGLCGVRVKGRGRRFYWATAPDKSGELGFKIGRRFGVTTTCLGDIEITDENADVLVVDDEQMYPLLLRRSLGEGTVYFLNSWAYPGALDADAGPGATVDSPGLIGYIYRHIAARARGRVWITEDGTDAGPECDFIAFSYFPSDGTICLHNIDFDRTHRCYVHHFGSIELVELAPGEFRRMKTQVG